MEANLKPNLDDLSDEELINLIHKKELESLSYVVVRSAGLKKILQSLAIRFDLNSNGDLIILDKRMYYINLNNDSYRIIYDYENDIIDIDIQDVKICNSIMTGGRY